MRRLFGGLLLAALLVTGCATEVADGERLTAGIERLRAEGGERPLKALVPGDWDTAHVILGPATSEAIDEQVGHRTGLGDFLTERAELLVLTRDGELERAVRISTRGIPEGSYRATVRLRAPGGPGSELDLVGG
ncbi:hypothetical protein [Saccharopolyspora sp. CA-218241]|uniref:hypothetical protein n=1 Tax=Saccharopolyspora sp. CA-218241 TaxID=3240027 RepID=UPI003D96CEFE